ncbi:MAG: diguanylate cyclase [Desulfarculaceae bacterium]|nr:diguanylate cyclase [Desulfarculaceae bacterium]MCF8048741.1 diguanylate cyclase [Desulfarculaceae bacterium]MCF8064020.1 diguanylate cyclase [Desulfarculaceae bacterium]MCF8096261.1 diguanylate cyclase [Desulfarculaceae bacterium]MCF8123471.1 diguanylate cyclase [Desulfarculaceae bacterium]
MGSILNKWPQGLSVGAKLAAALVLVALVSSLVIAGVQQWYLRHSAESYAKAHLSSHLKQVVDMVERTQGKYADPVEAMRRIGAGQLPASHRANDLLIFGINPQGDLVAPPIGDQSMLPPPEILRHMASSAWGAFSLTGNDGRPLAVAYDRLPSGELILAVASSREPPVGMDEHYRWAASLLTALLVAVIVAFTALLWSRWFLTRPLRRLTQEAEMAAQELVPPVAMERSDELGRLSVALASLTSSARDMVQKAQEEKARFERLFSQTKDGAYIVDHNGLISDANPALVSMLGLERREHLLGKDSQATFFVDREEAQLYLNSLQAQGYVQDFPGTMRRMDGSTFEALITATWAGQGKARFGLVRDVTQLRKDQMALHESEARYRRLVDNAPDIIYRWSLERGRFEYLSSATHQITGYSVQRIMRDDPPLLKAIHPKHRGRVLTHWRGVIRGRGPTVGEQEFMILDAKGRTRWLREKSILVRDELDKPLALEGIATDITERKLLEQELKRGHQMVANTLQGLPTAVMVLDRKHKVVHWNRAMERLTGFSAEEMVGTSRQWEPFYLSKRKVLADLVLDDLALEGNLERVLKNNGELSMKKSTLVDGGLEGEGFFPTLKPNGRQLYFLAAPIRDPEGRIVRAVETLVDLSDKRRLEQELRRLSVTDSLTGLYNQRFFYATLSREMLTVQRYGHSFSILMADIDFFKSYNDRFGHLAGDQALVKFSQALQRCVRGMDLACRYGGEEFAVLLPRTAMAEALAVAERLRAEVSRSDFTPEGHAGGDGEGGKAVRLTVSVGVATLGPSEESQGVVRRADDALYAAKQAGRNLVAADLRQGRIKVLPRGSQVLNSVEQG